MPRSTVAKVIVVHMFAVALIVRNIDRYAPQRDVAGCVGALHLNFVSARVLAVTICREHRG